MSSLSIQDHYVNPAQLLHNAAVDDILAVAIMAILSAVYFLRGTLWDKPDPYLHKMYERPQEEMGSQGPAALTRDVAERMEQVVSATPNVTTGQC